MSNRYSRTGFTKRQEDKLRKLEHIILDIINDRSGKQDSDDAIRRLFQAQASISEARYLSKQWKDFGKTR